MDFVDAEDMFRSGLLAEPDMREDYGERRWHGLGVSRGRILHVVFAEREPDSIRIISLRKATRREQEEYKKAIPDGLEAG
ncbi:MAG TPA: BrnT family toxin [Candidatus Sulfotelmatobacter sp.]|nr:BrnT family toxin [Candidatus Sulfotelmatobacter sp.]